MYSGIPSTDVDMRRTEWIQRNVLPCKEVNEGDFLYLVEGGQSIFATGRVDRIDQDYHRIINRTTKWRVTVTQRFGERRVSRREIDEVPALAGLFARDSGNSNFLLLSTKEVIALNRLLQPIGFSAPNDNDIHTALYLAAEKHKVLSALFVDLDHFKSVNKDYGYSVADQAVIEALEVVRTVVNGQGIVQRKYGTGDEMLVLLPGLREVEALAVADRCRTAIEASSFSGVGREVITATIVLVTYPDTFGDLDGLFDVAGRAVGRVKDEGRRNSVITLPKMLS